ncbi:hypothetical protein [Arthrobacter sp. NPDC090010]|uniref:hypothetical protein n=1 Tax=Arthrobacter sp. NPDC090010 TaxID=3363942 RepID=UPI00382840DE
MISKRLKGAALFWIALLCYLISVPWLARDEALEFPPFLLSIVAGAMLGLWSTGRIQRLRSLGARLAVRAGCIAVCLLPSMNLKPIFQLVPEGLAAGTVLFVSMALLPCMALTGAALMAEVVNLPGMRKKDTGPGSARRKS